MPKPQIDKSVKSLFYKILLITSKDLVPTDISNIIVTFYEKYGVSDSACFEIEEILQSVGIYKIGKEGMMSYVFKISSTYKLSNEKASRILNVACDLITKILLREELKAEKYLLKDDSTSQNPELEKQINHLDQEIAARFEIHNLFIQNCSPKDSYQIIAAENFTVGEQRC